MSPVSKLMEVLDGILCVCVEKRCPARNPDVSISTLKKCHDDLADGHLGFETIFQKIKFRDLKTRLHIIRQVTLELKIRSFVV